MAAIENSKKTTKDLILDAAFSFTKEPRFTAFSMSELAERVGISKAAIYRHYESKEAVFDAMNERFFNTFAELLLRLQKSCYTNPDIMPLIPFEDIIAFFADNVDYINFFIGSMANDSSFEKRIEKELENRGVTMLKHIQYDANDKETGTPERFARLIEAFYCGTSIFIFTKLREKMIQEGAKVDSVADFSKKIVEFFTKGLEGTCRTSSRFYPQGLSEKRMDEIDKMCRINPEDFPEEDRFFTALANVIKKYSFSGVTIEKIADEMNLAKSSLYSHFENKNKLITEQIRRELFLMQTIVMENCAEGKNFSEYLYIKIRSEFEYFMMRPSIIPICGWLLMSDEENPFFVEDCEDVKKIFNRKVQEKNGPDLGIPLSNELIEFWIAALPVALITQGQAHGLKRDDFGKALRIIQRFVEYGIDK